MLTSKPKKPKPTIKDLMDSNQIVKGKVVLEERLKQEKILAEAVEFEARNRRRSKQGCK